MYLEKVKNKPGRGASFIVRPRAQNCLATPLVGYLYMYEYTCRAYV